MSTSAPGPCTPAGKAIAARNATTHGLFARDIVLPALGEDPAAFDALLQQLCRELPPRNLMERHYLEQIAAASWRLRRLHRWPAQVYEDDTLGEDERLDKLDKVLRHENALTRQIDRAIRTLNRDLKWLFESRAREVPEMGIEVQRDVWQRLRSASAEPSLPGCRLDNIPEDPAPLPAEPETTQKCENEPPAPCEPAQLPTPVDAEMPGLVSRQEPPGKVPDPSASNTSASNGHESETGHHGQPAALRHPAARGTRHL